MPGEVFEKIKAVVEQHGDMAPPWAGRRRMQPGSGICMASKTVRWMPGSLPGPPTIWPGRCSAPSRPPFSPMPGWDNYTDTIGFKVSKGGLSFSGPWLQEYKFERYVLVNLATPRLMSPCMPEALISPSTSMVLDPQWLIAHGSPLEVAL